MEEFGTTSQRDEEQATGWMGERWSKRWATIERKFEARDNHEKPVRLNRENTLLRSTPEKRSSNRYFLTGRKTLSREKHTGKSTITTTKSAMGGQ